MNREFEYNVRTFFGLLLLVAGVVFSAWFAWWLIFEGDVINLIHAMKLALPGWAWTVLKFGLSGVAGIVLLSFFVLLAVIVFSGGVRK